MISWSGPKDWVAVKDGLKLSYHLPETMLLLYIPITVICIKFLYSKPEKWEAKLQRIPQAKLRKMEPRPRPPETWRGPYMAGRGSQPLSCQGSGDALQGTSIVVTTFWPLLGALYRASYGVVGGYCLS